MNTPAKRPLSETERLHRALLSVAGGLGAVGFLMIVGSFLFLR